eukprot:scaffold2879_cov269-Prasinococcus_capsulatus_cf.AAC.29
MSQSSLASLCNALTATFSCPEAACSLSTGRSEPSGLEGVRGSSPSSCPSSDGSSSSSLSVEGDDTPALSRALPPAPAARA